MFLRCPSVCLSVTSVPLNFDIFKMLRLTSNFLQMFFRWIPPDIFFIFFRFSFRNFFYGIFCVNWLSQNENFCFTTNLDEIWSVVSLWSPHKENRFIFFHFCIENYIFRGYLQKFQNFHFSTDVAEFWFVAWLWSSDMYYIRGFGSFYSKIGF